MRKKSKLNDLKHKEQVEVCRQMTPKGRLAAYLEHCRLVMEVYQAGVLYRNRGK